MRAPVCVLKTPRPRRQLFLTDKTIKIVQVICSPQGRDERFTKSESRSSYSSFSTGTAAWKTEQHSKSFPQLLVGACAADKQDTRVLWDWCVKWKSCNFYVSKRLIYLLVLNAGHPLKLSIDLFIYSLILQLLARSDVCTRVSWENLCCKLPPLKCPHTVLHVHRDEISL